MNWIQKIVRRGFGRRKSFADVGAFQRIFGQSWVDSQYLEAYEKSLYVYACVSKIAEKCGSINIRLFQILNSKGDTKEVYNHPALDLIYKPNPFQTKEEFIEILTINQLLSGNAFVYKVRNKSGRVVEMWNLRPDRVTIYPDAENFINHYEFTKDDGTKVSFAADEIVHLKKPSPINTYLGLAPLKPAAMRVDTEEFASRFQRDFFLNNARPDGVVEFPDSINESQIKEAEEGWNAKYKGSGKNSKTAFLYGGVKYQVISLTQKEMDFIESMKFTRDDILTAFKVPKPIVAITDDVNRANAETAMFIFLSENIKPEISKLVNKFNEMLVYPDFGDQFFYKEDDPTPENRDLKLREYQNGLTYNYLLINEVRAMEGKPPIKGGWTFYQPLTNLAAGGLPVDSEGNPKSLVPPKWAVVKDARIIENKKDDPSKAVVFRGRNFAKMKFEIREELERELPKLKARILKASKLRKGGKTKGKKTVRPIISKEIRNQYADMVLKGIDRQSVVLSRKITEEMTAQRDRVLARLEDVMKSIAGEDNIEKIKSFYKEKDVKVTAVFDKTAENKVVAEFIFPYLKEFADAAGADALSALNPANDYNTSKRLYERIKKHAEKLAEDINNTTVDGLEGIISEGVASGAGVREISGQIAEKYNEFDTFRSERIARTETTMANNEGMLEAYKQSDVATHKEWIATMDDRTRDAHAAADGEMVPVDEPFSSGLMYPGDPSADPADTINCRCVIAPAFEE